ncbi:MAG: radical SAM protein [Candidatus Melainabacteria bacterium]|nr:radical SAM protein [Candidatus Melainabacteria bacterium]
MVATHSSTESSASDPRQTPSESNRWVDPPLETLICLNEQERKQALGVDLDQYPATKSREHYEPVVTNRNRGLFSSLSRAYGSRLIGAVPNPVMLTHIVTTKCNYSCGFCSFADSLNAKTDELRLDEIEKTYASLGQSLNVIVYSGGETTLNRELVEIIEAAYRLTPVQSVYIISNAWKPNLLLDITHRIMQRCPGLHLTWSLSIEGPRNHNNQVRYTKATQWDAFQNTVDTLFGLKAIREKFGYHQLDVQLCTVCTPENAALMNDWYDWIRNVLQPDKWNLNLMRRSVQMSGNGLASFAERRKRQALEPFEETYLAITERVRQDVLSGALKFLYHTAEAGDGAMKSAVDLLSQEQNRRAVLQEKSLVCCKAGSFGAYIGSEGQVSACEEFAHHPSEPKSFGNLRDVNYDFQALWHSAKAQQFRKQVDRANECQGCTLESQRNYPAILVSFQNLLRAGKLAQQIKQ